ncbi:hypothetical protein YT1_3942 [Rhodococcus ruber]|nr:hypothetical protein YT1_3942 [Rhodococcus ruber]
MIFDAHLAEVCRRHFDVDSAGIFDCQAQLAGIVSTQGNVDSFVHCEVS